MTETRPPGLAEVEAHVRADEAPAVCLIDRATLRHMLAYVSALEAANALLRARARARPTTVYADEPAADWRNMVL